MMTVMILTRKMIVLAMLKMVTVRDYIVTLLLSIADNIIKIRRHTKHTEDLR